MKFSGKYEFVLKKDGERIGSVTWSGDLERAQVHARKVVEENGADSAEIWITALHLKTVSSGAMETEAAAGL